MAGFNATDLRQGRIARQSEGHPIEKDDARHKRDLFAECVVEPVHSGFVASSRRRAPLPASRRDLACSAVAPRARSLAAPEKRLRLGRRHPPQALRDQTAPLSPNNKLMAVNQPRANSQARPNQRGGNPLVNRVLFAAIEAACRGKPR